MTQQSRVGTGITTSREGSDSENRRSKGLVLDGARCSAQWRQRRTRILTAVGDENRRRDECVPCLWYHRPHNRTRIVIVVDRCDCNGLSGVARLKRRRERRQRQKQNDDGKHVPDHDTVMLVGNQQARNVSTDRDFARPLCVAEGSWRILSVAKRSKGAAGRRCRNGMVGPPSSRSSRPRGHIGSLVHWII